jgi:putative ABC transport system permease protein
MVRNFFLLAIRNLLKNKMQTLISITGLAVGFSVFILIGLYLKYEYSWDKYNKLYNRIYRAQEEVNLATETEYRTLTQAPLAKYLREHYPEVENSVLLREAWGEFLASSEVQTFYDGDGYYAEPTLFDIFTYDFIKGNPATALGDPYSIVLSEKMAGKLFPHEDALGKNVMLEKKYNLKVTGIFKELPTNTMVRPSYIIPVQLFEKTNNWEKALNDWTDKSFTTYILLKQGASREMLERKIVNLLDDYEVHKKQYKLYLLPLKDAFLHPGNQNDYLIALFLYGLIAVFIVLLASVNFVNITTASSSLRAKEIGIKKANGSSRSALIWQFLGESVIIALLAINVAFVISKIFLPVFNRITNRELQFTFQEHYGFIFYIVGIALAVGLLSGIYPALFLSSMKTITVLKSNFFSSQKGKVGLKKILVTFQLFISVFLIIAALMVFNQIHYMMNKDRGFNIHNILFASFSSERENGNISELRNRLLSCPEIENVTISATVPFWSTSGRHTDWEGSGDEQIHAQFNRVDKHFIDTYEIKIVQGRNFLADTASGIKECLINETAQKLFGWKDPIGKKLYNDQYQVVGVVRDFHYSDMHNRIEPYIFILHPGNVHGENIYSIRIQSGNLPAVRKKITGIFEDYFPEDAFEIWTLEDQLYKNTAYIIWDGVNKTFRFFTVLAILISAMGLFGLISFTAKRRTKEMGIRKVFGSKPVQIYLTITREFAPLLLVAAILGSCGAIVFYKYLPGAYKCPIEAGEFLIAWVMLGFITLATVSYQALQVANNNPVNALRYE